MALRMTFLMLSTAASRFSMDYDNESNIMCTTSRNNSVNSPAFRLLSANGVMEIISDLKNTIKMGTDYISTTFIKSVLPYSILFSFLINISVEMEMFPFHFKQDIKVSIFRKGEAFQN